MRRLLALFVVALLLVGCRKSHGGTLPAEGTIEITTSDITLAEVPPERLRVLGVALGDTVTQAEAALAQTNRYFMKPDSSNARRRYVYDKTLGGGEGDQACVLYFIWMGADPALARITVFRPFQERLVGETRNLLGASALDEGSVVRKRLGKPDQEEVTLDIPSIGRRHTSYFFRARGIELTRQKSTEPDREVTVFAFLRPGIDFRAH